MGVAVHVLLVHEGDTRRPWRSVTAELAEIECVTPAQIAARLAAEEDTREAGEADARAPGAGGGAGRAAAALALSPPGAVLVLPFGLPCAGLARRALVRLDLSAARAAAPAPARARHRHARRSPRSPGSAARWRCSSCRRGSWRRSAGSRWPRSASRSPSRRGRSRPARTLVPSIVYLLGLAGLEPYVPSYGPSALPFLGGAGHTAFAEVYLAFAVLVLVALWTAALVGIRPPVERARRHGAAPRRRPRARARRRRRRRPAARCSRTSSVPSSRSSTREQTGLSGRVRPRGVRGARRLATARAGPAGRAPGGRRRDARSGGRALAAAVGGVHRVRRPPVDDPGATRGPRAHPAAGRRPSTPDRCWPTPAPGSTRIRPWLPPAPPSRCASTSTRSGTGHCSCRASVSAVVAAGATDLPVDRYGSIRRPGGLPVQLYGAVVPASRTVASRDAAGSEGPVLSDEERDESLALPPKVHPRVRALALEIATGRDSPRARLDATIARLQDGYSYTLAARPLRRGRRRGRVPVREEGRLLRVLRDGGRGAAAPAGRAGPLRQGPERGAADRPGRRPARRAGERRARLAGGVDPGRGLGGGRPDAGRAVRRRARPRRVIPAVAPAHPCRVFRRVGPVDYPRSGVASAPGGP